MYFPRAPHWRLSVGPWPGGRWEVGTGGENLKDEQRKGAEPAGRWAQLAAVGTPATRGQSHVPYPPTPLCEKVDIGLLCGRCPTAFPADALWQGNKTNEAAWNRPMLTTCHELRFPKSQPWVWRAVIEPQDGDPASVTPAGGGCGRGSVGKGPIHTPHSQLG